MKNSEEALEKVLAGLRDCEAPVGMENRILRKVQDRASARAVPGWHVLVSVWMGRRIFSAAAVFLVCAVSLAGLFSILLEIHQPGQTLSTRFSMKVPAAGSMPLPMPVATVHMAQFPPREASARSTGKTIAPRVGTFRHADSFSRHAMQAAVSYPAPPLPLTEQERLLLHVARHGDEAELAMLNPAKQAMQVEKEKEEFKEFFGQTTVRNEESNE